MKERKIRGGRQNKWSNKNNQSFEINARTVSVLKNLLARYGLDFRRIGRRLRLEESRVHEIIVEVERWNYRVVEDALRVFAGRQKAKGRGLKRGKHGVLPLEYFLTAF